MYVYCMYIYSDPFKCYTLNNSTNTNVEIEILKNAKIVRYSYRPSLQTYTGRYMGYELQNI